MSPIMIFALVSIVLTALLAAFYLHIRAKERRMMLEYGLDPSLINIYSKNNGGMVFLFIGIILLGIAMGVSTGILLARRLNIPGETKELIILSLIIFTGISCVLCYYLSRYRSR
jgi:hypothetical protein